MKGEREIERRRDIERSEINLSVAAEGGNLLYPVEDRICWGLLARERDGEA
jgi:hypothetical protein